MKKKDPRSHFLENELPAMAGAALAGRMKAKKQATEDPAPSSGAGPANYKENQQDNSRNRSYINDTDGSEGLTPVDKAALQFPDPDEEARKLRGTRR